MKSIPAMSAFARPTAAIRGRALLLSAAGISALLLASPALAQTKAKAVGQTIRLAPVEKPFNPALLQYPKRAPIPFKPFERVELVTPDAKTDAKALATPKPITARSVITLPSGKTAPAGAYYDELDKSERYLNEHGLSLRTMSDTMPTTVASIPVDDAAFKAELAKAPPATRLPPLANFEATHGEAALSAKTPIAMTPEAFAATGLSAKLLTPEVLARGRALNASGTRALHWGNVVIGPVEAYNSLLIPQLQMVCLPFADTRNWDQHTGSASTFAAYVNASVSYDGLACPTPPAGQTDHQSHFTVTAEANAGGSVFNNTQNLLHVGGSLVGSRVTNQITASLNVVVLGQTIASVSQSYNGHWSVDNTVQHNLDFSTSTYIPIGPFSIHAVLGAQGQASFHYVADLYPTSVLFAGTPNVSVNAYAQVALNALVAEVGASANLTLVNWTGHVNANAGMGVIWVPVAVAQLYADSSVSLLGGNVSAYVKWWSVSTCKWHGIPYPCGSWKQANYPIFDWPGYHYNSVLFDKSYFVAL